MHSRFTASLRPLMGALAFAALCPTFAFAQTFVDTAPCVPPPPPPAINDDRSLWVHDVPTLTGVGANFSLRRTLTQLANQAVAAGAVGTTATSIFEELWDTQNTAPGLGLGAHCDDFTTFGIAGFTLNDFPLSCRPVEGGQANGSLGITADQFIDNYIAIGLVNRMDLADADWNSCGEFRIVYAKRPGFGPGRNFIIFEAVMPNPKPGCRSACEPLADFWANLSTIASPNVRAIRLQQFYYNGFAGFPPVVQIDHYSFGSGMTDGGQIRTNQFMVGPWLLKEFKLALVSTSSVQLDVVPVTVKVNPYGELFNSSLPATSPFEPRGTNFRNDFMTQLGDLGINDINGYFYSPDDAHNWGESNAQGIFEHQYAQQTNIPGVPTPFMVTLDTFAPPLTRDHFANRALTLSCGGCHEPRAYALDLPGSIADPASPIAAPVSPFALGGTTDKWPLSLGFTHANENPVGLPPAFPLSQALTDVFLPFRRALFSTLIALDRCDCVPVPVVAARMASDPVVARSADERDAALGRDDGAMPLVMDAAQEADGDPEFARLLVTAEVQAMDAAEPPRLNITGTVRTH